MIARSAYEQETRAAERFLTAFDAGLERQSSGRARKLRIARWRARLNASGVYSAGGRAGFVPRLIPFLQMEHPEVCAEVIAPDQINGQLRLVARALWLCHLLSSNTDLRGWSNVRRHYGAEDVTPAAELVVRALSDDEDYLWLLGYGRALAALWLNTHSRSHAAAAYLGWFSALPVPHW